MIVLVPLGLGLNVIFGDMGFVGSLRLLPIGLLFAVFGVILAIDGRRWRAGVVARYQREPLRRAAQDDRVRRPGCWVVAGVPGAESAGAFDATTGSLGRAGRQSKPPRRATIEALLLPPQSGRP